LVIWLLVVIFNFSFLISICSGQTSGEFPAFANTQRWQQAELSI